MRPVALITGAGRGIGRAASLALARASFNLVLFSRSESPLAETFNLVKGLEADAITVPGDVRVLMDVERVRDEALRRFGRIDVLVYNAGIGFRRPFAEQPASEIVDTVETNLTGLMLMTHAVLPAMLRQRLGLVINISSGAGRSGIPELASYCATKFGVIGFTEALAREVAGRGLTVVAIAPGSVDTRMYRENFPGTPARSRPEEVAQVIAEIAGGRRRVRPGEVVELFQRR